MSINEIQDEIIDEFNAFDDWMDRYSLLIDYGNNLEPFPEADRTDKNLIDGCQSKVWFTAELQQPNNANNANNSDNAAGDAGALARGNANNANNANASPIIIYHGDSDAILVKGIVALLIRVLSGHTPQEILHTDLYFIDAINLREHLSPTRSNGLAAMLKQMQLFALAFSAKE